MDELLGEVSRVSGVLSAVLLLGTPQPVYFEANLISAGYGSSFGPGGLFRCKSIFGR